MGGIDAPAPWVRLAFARLAPMAALPRRHRSEASTSPARIAAKPTAWAGKRSDFEGQVLPQLDAAYSFARFLARDADAAHDIVQEAFLRAYRAYEGFRGGDPRAWLLSIVRNCYRDWRAAHGRTRRFEVDVGEAGDRAEDDDIPEAMSEEDSPETAIIRKSEAERVRAVLERLPQPLREMLVLRELEDLSYREIAAVTDLPIGTVMSRLARARTAFGDAWQASAEEGRP